MKNYKLDTKKIISTLVAAGVLASGTAVFAEYYPEKTADPNLDYTTTSATDGEAVNNGSESEVTYNGATIPAVPVVNVDGHKMVPLRYVMEFLNFVVVWNEEDQKIQCLRGAQEFGMNIGLDSYYFSKMMPVSFGIAPSLVDGETTYVPVEFLTNLVGVDVYEGGDDYVIVVEPADVTLNSIEKGEDENSVLSVQDARLGEVIVRVSEDTILKDGDKELDLNTLVDGQELKIGYGAAMTLSLPPQTTAISIETVGTDRSGEADGEDAPNVIDSVPYEGTITAVEEDRIIIDDNGIERALMVYDDTVITRGNDKRIYKLADLTVGSKVKGNRSAIETRSIPPISNVDNVEIVELVEE